MVETRYHAIPDEYFGNYFKFLIGKVWKILPMQEEGDIHLKEYMEGLQRELIGNMNLVSDLKCDGYFITLLNKIEFLISEEYTHTVLRKEIFECIDCINKISNKYHILQGCDYK